MNQRTHGQEQHQETLRAMLAKVAKSDVSKLDLDADLVRELGLDSLAGLRLLAAVEKRFKVRFPDDRLREFNTLRRILEVLVGDQEEEQP